VIRRGRPAEALAVVAAAVLACAPARAAEIAALGGDSIDGASPSQGSASFAAAGLAWEKAIFRRASARLEVFPALVVREREHPVSTGLGGRRDTFSSAACLLGRYAMLDRGDVRILFEAGTGPFYAWDASVPEGGTHGNFLDQIGFTGTRGRWSASLRFVHVSNLDLAGRRRNPGFSFLAAGVELALP